jgi:hypothetical protein
MIAYFDKGHVAQITSREDIAEIEKQGYTFTGIVLVDKQVIKQSKLVADEILLNRVYGVMKAGESQEIIEYILAAFKGDNGIDRMTLMKNYIGVEGNSAEEINNATIRKMEEVVRLGAEGKIDKVVVEAELKILSGIREILMVAVLQEDSKWLDKAQVGDIVAKVEDNRKLSQQVIVKAVSAGSVNADFVVNVAKLQKAVVQKDLNETFARMKSLMKDGKTDLGALMEIQGKEDLKTPMQLFKLSNIYAVASAA